MQVRGGDGGGEAQINTNTTHHTSRVISAETLHYDPTRPPPLPCNLKQPVPQASSDVTWSVNRPARCWWCVHWLERVWGTSDVRPPARLSCRCRVWLKRAESSLPIVKKRGQERKLISQQRLGVLTATVGKWFELFSSFSLAWVKSLAGPQTVGDLMQPWSVSSAALSVQDRGIWQATCRCVPGTLPSRNIFLVCMVHAQCWYSIVFARFSPSLVFSSFPFCYVRGSRAQRNEGARGQTSGLLSCVQWLRAPHCVLMRSKNTFNLLKADG